jgi:hypothetical protein
LIWILIAGFYIDAINIDEIIGIQEMIHEEYDGESITADMDSQNIDIPNVAVYPPYKIIQNKSVRVSHGVQFIDEDSPSVAASTLFEDKELILLIKQQSVCNYTSNFIPSTSPITLGKILI